MEKNCLVVTSAGAHHTVALSWRQAHLVRPKIYFSTAY